MSLSLLVNARVLCSRETKKAREKKKFENPCLGCVFRGFLSPRLESERERENARFFKKTSSHDAIRENDARARSNAK